MFNRIAKSDRAEQERQARRLEYEFAVKRVYEYESLTLAIARMTYYDGYTFRKDVLGERVKTRDNFTMYGVVHESDDRRIHCEVNFTNGQPSDGVVGNCFLTYPLEDRKKNDEDRRLMLCITIWDYESEWRHKAYSNLRDAAISHNRFCHFEIRKENCNVTEALSSIHEKGYGPTINILEFLMWPTIILPSAPEWGWKQV